MRSVYFQTKSIRTTGGTESISQNYHPAGARILSRALATARLHRVVVPK